MSVSYSMPGSRSSGLDAELSRSPREGFFTSMSGTFVSVELLNMRQRPRSNIQRATRRVVLKASITSVILLTVAFIITYSVLLTYVSSKVPLMRHQDASSSTSADKSKSGKRTKLVARPMEFETGNILKFVKNNIIKWDVKDVYDTKSANPICSKESKIVILIASAPGNSNRRKSIRDTWCKASNYNFVTAPWQCVFLIGQSVEHVESVKNESVQHGDILQGSYIDSYRNLTVKVLHGLDWTRQSCHVNYVVKTDDDVYVNTNLLYSLISKSTPTENVYIGLVMQTDSRLKVIRNPVNRWYVSFEEYSGSHYPPYAIGMGYIISIDVVTKLITASQEIPPFANEDAYVGVLMNHVSVVPYRSGRFTLTASGLQTCNMRYLVMVHAVSAVDQQRMLDMDQTAARTCHKQSGEADNSWL